MRYRVERETLCGRRCLRILPQGEQAALPLFVCHVGEQADELIFGAIAALPHGFPPIAFAAVTQVSWDQDYTPWPGEWLSGRVFTGGADAYLALVEEALLPWAMRDFQATGCCSLGYSLGGLCALYALTRSVRYAGGASVSGALWYPGFLEYFGARRPDCPVYCSLGRAESRTRHVLMVRGADCAQAIASRPEDCFEWTNGNHFFEIPQRIARAVQALCK